MAYRFGAFRLDPERAELLQAGNAVTLEPQVFALLVLLVEGRERLVTKDEIIEKVWDGRAVSDSALNSRISMLRRALCDDGVAQSVIQTVRSRGFRFVAAVQCDGGAAPVSQVSGEDQVVRFCKTADGASIAYATVGHEGPVLIKAANWLNHLEYDWVSPVWRDLFTRLSQRRILIRYDARGSGMSDRDVDDLSLASFSRDLETVIEATGHQRFALLGISQGAAVAIQYAVAHPERVSHLILWGGFARGRRRRDNPEDEAQADAFLTLMRQGWGQQSHPTFQKLFATLYLPNGSAEQLAWWTDLQRIASSPEMAVRTRQAIDDIDVTALLPQLKVPTLILQSEHEAVVPLAEARLMASLIPDARVLLLDSTNHLILPQEVDWTRALQAIDRFLAET